MIGVQDLQRAAYVEIDQNGQPVVQISLELWEAWLTQENRARNDRLLALLDAWDAEPNDTSAEWWDDFQAFLNDNRLKLS